MWFARFVLHHYGKNIAIIKEGRKIHIEKEFYNKNIDLLLSFFIRKEHLEMKNKIKYHSHKEISKKKVNTRYLKAATCVIHLRPEMRASMVRIKNEETGWRTQREWGRNEYYKFGVWRIFVVLF